jgi:hypothetical protein
MSKEGILSILSKKIERSLRLVEAAAPTPRRAIPPFVTRHSSLVIRFFKVSFSIKLAALAANGWADT